MINQNLFRKEFLKLYKNAINFCNDVRSTNRIHVPVLCRQTVDYLDTGRDKIFIDMTFGAGGHSRRILRKCSGSIIYALDRDPIAHAHAKCLSKEYPGRVIPLLGKFSDVPQLLKQFGVKQKTVDGILFDFGCSSMQFDEANRGFSLSKNGPLDMRMDRVSQKITAADVLAKIEESDLVNIIRIYGQEKGAKMIARAIVESRSAFFKITTTKQLADLISSCMTEPYRVEKLHRPIHLATKTFQAIRIFINNELNEVNYGMIVAQRYLKKGGRLVTITFHSLEDTIVKRHINGNIIEGLANPVPLKYSSHDVMHDREVVDLLFKTNWKQLNKHVVIPSDEELMLNTRSRSAKLRAVEKIN